MAQDAQVAEAQESHQDELLQLQNVVGVAASLKISKNQVTDVKSLTVLVTNKVALSKLKRADRIPAEIDKVPTDVIEVGEIVPLQFTARTQPAQPGFSIGHFDITAGTFGCVVQDLRWRPVDEPVSATTASSGTGDYLILSNNHVLAAVNQAEVGDLILQPGPADGGVFPSDAVATLDRFQPIVFGVSGYNLVDAAAARPLSDRSVVAAIIGQFIPTGIDQAQVGDQVVKVGRTTQVTNGTVIANNATVNVNFGAAGQAQFRNQILTTAMSQGGDSGSLLMNGAGSAVGLLFAGSPVVTIHNHISNVEMALGVRPLTAPRS